MVPNLRQLVPGLGARGFLLTVNPFEQREAHRFKLHLLMAAR